ncbi:hypothetical protein BO78DRAFT_421850 [Aspergillus sclerotiicarbonarius CBS 121057]|uniref:2EXR domain-containing protein n=1 Tax=Aspergillus sclerotiicarbonarius (strain CBS 121057 / IBT 28362) TaxID=1448318 RepID=A0A319EHC7_ASPSB|nr:hypothetical protein BO78DRAFT_421850 [Aspergillus sclerotiicarbonarius CBS 121057]
MEAPDVDFPLFSHLPTELRIQIWGEALPKFRRPLYFYRKGCWRLRRVGQMQLRYEFDHRLLDDMKFEIPLFSTNREARDVVMRWIHKQGVKVQFDTATDTFWFRRAFNPKYDTLFVPWDRWPEFVFEADRMWRRNPDHEGMTIDWMEPAFTQIAVPWKIVATGYIFLTHLFHARSYSSIQKVFLVVNFKDMPREEIDGKAQSRWELGSLPKTAMFKWIDNRDHFQGGDTPYYDEVSWYEMIRHASYGMTKGCGWHEDHQLEVQFVSVTKK